VREDDMSKQEEVLTMVVTAGMFIMGKLVGSAMLRDPRVFQFLDEGKRISLSPLPGTPSFITLGESAFSYKVPEGDRNLVDLYKRVTTPVQENPLNEMVKMDRGNVREFQS
jgi:hypothetical protein